jgi:hypothetical protein
MCPHCSKQTHGYATITAKQFAGNAKKVLCPACKLPAFYTVKELSNELKEKAKALKTQVKQT